MHIEVWFDRYQFKTWLVSFFDEEGTPYGESEYFHLKSEAVDRAKRIASPLKIAVKVFTRAGIEL